MYLIVRKIRIKNEKSTILLKCIKLFLYKICGASKKLYGRHDFGFENGKDVQKLNIFS